MLKIQNLRRDEINEQMREMLLSTGKTFNDLYGYFSRGIEALLRYFGDPTQVMEMHIQAIREREQREREEQERLKREEEAR